MSRLEVAPRGQTAFAQHAHKLYLDQATREKVKGIRSEAGHQGQDHSKPVPKHLLYRRHVCQVKDVPFTVWIEELPVLIAESAQDLAIFDLTIDNQPRACRLIGLHVRDIVLGEHWS